MIITKVYIVTRTVDGGKKPQKMACLTQDSAFAYIDKSKKQDLPNRDIEYKVEGIFFCNADLKILGEHKL